MYGLKKILTLEGGTHKVCGREKIGLAGRCPTAANTAKFWEGTGQKISKFRWAAKSFTLTTIHPRRHTAEPRASFIFPEITHTFFHNVSAKRLLGPHLAGCPYVFPLVSMAALDGRRVSSSVSILQANKQTNSAETGNQNSYLVKRTKNGEVQLSRDPLNLANVNSRKVRFLPM